MNASENNIAPLPAANPEQEENVELTLPKRRRRKTTLTLHENLLVAKAAVARTTGLNVDLHRMSDDDTERFAKLAQKWMDNDDGLGNAGNWNRLSRSEREDFEALIAASSGRPQSYFADERENATTTAKVREIAARALKRPQRPLVEEAGNVVLDRRIFLPLLIDGQLSNPDRQVLTPADVGMLVLILLAFENADDQGRRLLARNALLIEEDGELVLSIPYGFTPVDPRLDADGRIGGSWPATFRRLKAATFLQGTPWRFKLGCLGRLVIERQLTAATSRPA